MSPLQTRPRGEDLLAELCEQVLAEGRALNVDPALLLRMTAEAFDFLAARAPRPPEAWEATRGE